MEYLADRSMEASILLKEIHLLRASHPRMGGRKLYLKLEGFMLEHSIKMGRDCYISLLTEAYSHKLVGYHVSDSLDAIGTLAAQQNGTGRSPV